jgi:hypothetical protein
MAKQDRALGVERRVMTATVVFVGIPNIKEWPPQLAYRGIAGLHYALRQTLRRDLAAKASVHVLSALTGAILIVPDGTDFYTHRYLQAMAAAWAAQGIPVRAGVVHGEVELLSDVDGLVNVIGEPINIAARIAVKGKAPGCVLEDGYLDFAGAASDLAKGKRVSLKGKSHDRGRIRGLQLRAQDFPTVSRVIPRRLPAFDERPDPVNGVALGYDLPKFSAGDRAELSKRFRAVADAFASLKAEGKLPRRARLSFSPGGDGGVIVLTADKRKGKDAAERLLEVLSVESVGKHSAISVDARIAVHYGAVLFYTNAVGVLRPTGKVCFVADELASDQPVANERGVVFSEAFRDVVSDGSRAAFARDFEDLPTLRRGPAKLVKRFSRRRALAGKDSLLDKLSGARSSWEPAQ